MKRLLVVVLPVLVVLVVLGRWMSPNLTVAERVSGRWCDVTSDYCVERVTRADWVFLASTDQLHLVYKSQPRYYTVTTPFDADDDLMVKFGDEAVDVTDGTATFSWPAATRDRLQD